MSLEAGEGKIMLTFNTSRFGVRLADGVFDASLTMGELHARVRRKLMKATGQKNSLSFMTFLFLRVGTEAFVPTPEQTLGTLFDAYATAKEARRLALTVDTELFSG